MRSEKQTKHPHILVDFPEFDLADIRIGSRFYVILNRLRNNGVVLKDQYNWMYKNNLLNPKISCAYFNLHAMRNESNWNRAKKPWALINALTGYLSAGNLDAAEKLIEISQNIVATDEILNRKCALACAIATYHLKRQQYEVALDVAMSALAWKNDDLFVLSIMANCYAKMGRYCEAVKTMHLACENGFGKSQKKVMYNEWRCGFTDAQNRDFTEALKIVNRTN
ncbi:tetratricopeptide repeat protein [Photobacterium damselae]|uniref:tetratricopeptide repeat protein n=1 Tax=Photobacterium damselae TaxID=38293 RepID=UPI001F40B551|nr:hypothetical protein [Photobacterium damselae]UKA05034.1 hypothetical protein IHC89_22570 [Photobacterium damselae subsp. damselae]